MKQLNKLLLCLLAFASINSAFAFEGQTVHYFSKEFGLPPSQNWLYSNHYSDTKCFKTYLKEDFRSEPKRVEVDAKYCRHLRIAKKLESFFGECVANEKTEHHYETKNYREMNQTRIGEDCLCLKQVSSEHWHPEEDITIAGRANVTNPTIKECLKLFPAEDRNAAAVIYLTTK